MSEDLKKTAYFRKNIDFGIQKLHKRKSKKCKYNRSKKRFSAWDNVKSLSKNDIEKVFSSILKIDNYRNAESEVYNKRIRRIEKMISNINRIQSNKLAKENQGITQRKSLEKLDIGQ